MHDRADERVEAAWRDSVKKAVWAVFPVDVARRIGAAEAFGALVHRVREHARERNVSLVEVLGAVGAEDREFAGHADDPAAFLAAKVSDLPDEADGASRFPRAVVEVTDVARTFVDAVERVGAEEFGEEARALRPADLAWVIDQLDDVRQAVSTVLEEMTNQAELFGADRSVWNSTVSQLESAGIGLYTAMDAIDPQGQRMAVTPAQ